MNVLAYKRKLLAAGHTRSAIISKKDMVALSQTLEKNKRVIETPPNELRYIEGLLDLPFGHIECLRVIAKNRKCRCGRLSTGLDVVAHAAATNTHPRMFMRDVIIGLRPIFELAEPGGRKVPCYGCRLPITIMYYFNKGWLYA